MPVIDDPISMIRCMNKVFLMELMQSSHVPTPPTVMVADRVDLPRVMDQLGLPLVVKIPDGSFSRGVHKVSTVDEFKRIADELFEETDLLLAQKFLPTEYDWRVGVLSGQPLFVCQYRMARGHWQILKHRADGSSREGGHRTFGLDQAPADVMDLAVRAARPIGDGLYGVDLKQTPDGIVVMEVNDNPNIEHGVEDAAGKDEVWIRILRWFIERLESRPEAQRPAA
jgi:glutathione synthase/RimK-type ligase-like ATP-grasp enzyme